MLLLHKYKQVYSIHNITYWLIIYFAYMSGTVLVLHLFTFVSRISMRQTMKKLFVL
jgi:phage-related protein